MSRRLGKEGEETQWASGIINWCWGCEEKKVVGENNESLIQAGLMPAPCLIQFDYGQTGRPIRVNSPSLQISQSVSDLISKATANVFSGLWQISLEELWDGNQTIDDGTDGCYSLSCGVLGLLQRDDEEQMITEETDVSEGSAQPEKL